jgi:hypothetical protein
MREFVKFCMEVYIVVLLTAGSALIFYVVMELLTNFRFAETMGRLWKRKFGV